MGPNSTTLIFPTASTSIPHSSAARIRENQRRSRARRKQYLQELESKLRKCEQAGIKASVDLQLAARGVAEENKRLREENEALREEGKRLRGENETMMVALKGLRQGCGKMRVDGGHSSSHEAGDAEPEASCQLKDSTGHQVEETTTTATGEEFYTRLSPALPKVAPEEISDIGRENEMVLSDDTSSCEYAAHIITSMRADISTDDVRADLGCGGGVAELRRCTVDNSRLFVAVDRYAG